MRILFTTPALRRLLFIGGCLLLNAAAQAQSPAVDPAFPPVQITKLVNGVPWPAYIADVVRQPDGKYLVGGDFQTLNGLPASNLARLLPNGSVDAAFTAACAADAPVNAIVLQPDGKVLVSGSFQNVGGGGRRALARLQTNGTLDPSFAPPVGQLTAAGSLALQPDGKVLAAGRFNVAAAGAGEQTLLRFDGATGQYDPSFQFTLPTVDSYPSRLLLQPDGKIVVGGSVPSYRQAMILMRLDANGAADTSFPQWMNRFSGGITSLALDDVGRIYAAGLYNGMGGGHSGLRRYLPNGSVDMSFNFAGQNTEVTSVALQPNGRVLAGTATTERVLANGAVDASYLGANGPLGTSVTGIRRLLVDPSGAILAAGSFSLAGTSSQTQIGLVRLLDANVLAVQPSAASTQLAAWPIPAHDVLHLRLSAAGQRVQLLDVLGRVVRSYQQPAAQLSIPVAGLPAGAYQLRVAFTDGRQATRRVVVQ